MATVRWTIKARRDIRSLQEYIAQTSPAYASGVAARITSVVRPLRDYPRLGRVVPEYGRVRLREVVSPPYRIVYRLVEQDDVEVLAIVDGRRNLSPILGDDPESIR